MKIIFPLLIFITFLFTPSISYAHSGGGLIGDYIVTFRQEPLSPFVDENVQVIIQIVNKEGQPVVDLPGKLIIKRLEVDKFVGKDTVQEYTEIFSKQEKTDIQGSIILEYEFPKEAVYDVEFVWGGDEETQSAGVQILPRSNFLLISPKSAIRQIWFLVGVMFIGVIVGAVGSFIMLTMTLHPKK